jgi:hypothetical protein
LSLSFGMIFISIMIGIYTEKWWENDTAY